jgi:hypothetical protein
MTKPSSYIKRTMTAQFAGGPRYCEQCKQQRPRAGGREIAFNNGKNQRWVCAMHNQEGTQ